MACENGSEKEKESGAGLAMDAWAYERSYPIGQIDVGAYEQAYYTSRSKYRLQKSDTNTWQSLGPHKAGGRTLCLAFHPTDPDIIYAGTSGGGLWRTEKGARDVIEWRHVPTGFPLLGVGAIHIDPANPDIILLGTGECYNSIGYAEPGTVNRLVRGMYGIGILRSEDGGSTWTRTLLLPNDQATGVSDFAISNQNPNVILASTSVGAYKSTDGGQSWRQVYEGNIVIDIEIHPDDDQQVIMSVGGLNLNDDPSQNGLYRSTDGGDTFSEITGGGLPRTWSGNAKLTLDPQDGNTIIASIQEAAETRDITPRGLYRSTNFGDSWEHISDTNVALWQGWYSHDIAIHPERSNEMTYVGVDTWQSTNSGGTFLKKSRWDLWSIGTTGDESSPFYVHGDIHAVYYHPLNSDHIWLATDGGVFRSTDGGDTYKAMNNGLVVAQFYPNVSSSSTFPNYMIGGTQDNGTWKYDGTQWTRVHGGDGSYTAIDPTNGQLSYASSQFLNIVRSSDGFHTKSDITPRRIGIGERTAFIAPYELAPSSPNRMYAGRQRLYNSTASGFGWSATSSDPIENASVIVNLAISHQTHRTLYVATAPDPLRGFGSPKLWKTENGGVSFTQMQGLPDRVIKDIAFDPTDDQIAYVVFSGFHSEHMAKTTDGGASWQLVEGLPNVPTNAILIDPANPNHIYVGNDIGVFFSEDAGGTWESMNEGLTDAIMVMHLHLSPANRKLRMATHGRGIYEADMVYEVATSTDDWTSDGAFDIKIRPNPVQNALRVTWSDELLDFKKVEVYSANGSLLSNLDINRNNNGALIDVSTLSAGQYFVRLQGSNGEVSRAFVKM